MRVRDRATGREVTRRAPESAPVVIAYHWARMLNVDGTPSTTLVPCQCPATTAHDLLPGPTDDQLFEAAARARAARLATPGPRLPRRHRPQPGEYGYDPRDDDGIEPDRDDR